LFNSYKYYISVFTVLRLASLTFMLPSRILCVQSKSAKKTTKQVYYDRTSVSKEAFSIPLLFQ